MKTKARRRYTLSTMAWCLLFAAAGAAQEPVKIRFENAGGDQIAVEPVSGWPLTLVLDIDRSRLAGFGYVDMLRPFPSDGVTGFLVFEDPDGCPSWNEFSEQERLVELTRESGGESIYPRCPILPPAPWPRDETWIEITPGTATVPAECRAPYGIWTFEFSRRPFDGSGSNSLWQPIGPCVSSEAGSPGYGANPRLPALVVLADAGMGVVVSELFRLPSPREARNLAGFFHSVAYEAKTSHGGTRVTAFMHVPAGLFDPITLADGSHGDGCGVRVDGEDACPQSTGPKSTGPPPKVGITVRAFVVDQGAPAALDDRDGNGIVDIEDAELAGYKPLSNEATFRFTILPRGVAPFYFLFDFDGDGLSDPPPVAPSGPGGLVDPPP